MRLIRLTGLCLVAVVMTGAVAAASASAVLPELGRCVKLTGVKEGGKTVYKGNYRGRTCTTVSPAKDGKYEWSPGPGALKKFTGEFEEVILTPVNKDTITCGVGTSTGEYTGPKTQTATITLINCENTAHIGCQTIGAILGEIKSQPLNGELGFIVGGAVPKAGLDLKPATGEIFAALECGGEGHGTGTQTLLEGSLIGQIMPIDRMTSGFKVKYKTSGGKQSVEKFEGGAKDTLTATTIGPLLEKISEETTLTGTHTVANEEPLEIKAK